MQIFIFFDVPSILDFIVRRFGIKSLFVVLCAWETVLPVVGCFPHTSHVLDIKSSSGSVIPKKWIINIYYFSFNRVDFLNPSSYINPYD